MKNCIACAEEIKAEAQLCKHCGTRQDDHSFASSAPSEQPEEPQIKAFDFGQLLTIFPDVCAAWRITGDLGIFFFFEENEFVDFNVGTLEYQYFEPEDLEQFAGLVFGYPEELITVDRQSVEDEDQLGDTQLSVAFNAGNISYLGRPESVHFLLACLACNVDEPGFDGKFIDFLKEGLEEISKAILCSHTFEDADAMFGECETCGVEIARPAEYLTTLI
jgi:hypothetical protein